MAYTGVLSFSNKNIVARIGYLKTFLGMCAKDVLMVSALTNFEKEFECGFLLL
jgi:hypothetical protein